MRAEHHREPDFGGPDWGGNDQGPRIPRFLAGGEDPTMWSVPLYRIGRFEVRAHWIWIVGLVLGAILTIPLNKLGPVHELTAIGWGVVLVLAREHFRHLVSGAASDGPTVAVLWDFGCMNLPDAEAGPVRPMWHALGALLFNAVMVPVTALLVVAAGGGWEALIFNPADLPTVVGGLASPGLAVAWWLYAMNLAILGANLLPMLPMDGARAMVVRLTAERGREGAVLRVARIGMYVAGGTLVAAVAAGSGKLAATALVGALVCWVQTSRSKLLGIGSLDHEYRPEHDRDDEHEPWRTPRSEAQETSMSTSERPRNAPSKRPAPDKADAQREREAQELDRVLEKISREGMPSLTPQERATLEEATRRRREGGAP